MHYYCLILASGLKQEIDDDNADFSDFNGHYIYGFAITDIIKGRQTKFDNFLEIIRFFPYISNKAAGR